MRIKIICKPKRSFSAHANERKSFGSFHSEDIETLIKLPPTNLPLPDIYHEINQLSLSSINKNWVYGRDCKEKFFVLDKNWTFINHGAFGGALKPILEASYMWRNYIESQPLRFFDRDLFALQCYGLHSIAKLINASPLDLLPITNVTHGLNVIFQTYKSLPPTKEKDIVYLSLTYGSTKKMIQDFVSCTKDSHQYRMKMISITLPIQSEETLCAEIINSINHNTKMIVLDHITSNTAIILPIHKIAKACKQKNPQLIVIIDAAHSLFSQSIQLMKKDDNNTTITTNEDDSLSQYIDFWLTNGHKWLSSCKGSAVMWISSRIVHLRPTIVSHGYQPDNNNSNEHLLFIHPDKKLSAFAWDGCRDYVPFLCFPMVINLWNQIAITAPNHNHNHHNNSDNWYVFRDYICTLLNTVERLFQEEWSIKEEDFLCPFVMRRYSPMRLIPIPTHLLSPSSSSHSEVFFTDTDAFQLQEILYHHYQIEVPIKCIEKKLFVRISGHIYNTIEDYQKIIYTMKQISKQ